MLSVKAMGEKFLIWIEVIEDDICVGGRTSCENDYLGKGGQLLQKLLTMWSDTNTCLHKQISTAIVLPPSMGKLSLVV